jgi:hypothetical protein
MGMLPTPKTMDAKQMRELTMGQNISQTTGVQYGIFLTQMANNGMLPTPTCMDSTNATATMKSTQVKEGSMHSMTLTRAMASGILPTVMARDWKGCESRRKDIPSYIEDTMGYQSGKTSQLNPLFVAEMMGFPTDWTILPFQSGETKASRDTEMP